MTPLAFAQMIANDLAFIPVPVPLIYPAPTEYALPAEFHHQLGEIIVACQGTYVSVTNVTEADPFGAGGFDCGLIQMAELSIIAARECANVSNDDGTTNWPAQDAVSAQMDLDGTLLWEWADKQRADAVYRLTPPTLTYTITGGMAMTILGVQLPIP